MVLVNTLTVEAINTALIALQRGQSIVVGGEKPGTTVNNITISNGGGGSGGSGLDFTPQITALDKRVGLLEKAEELLRQENERQNERLEALEGLGITDFYFDDTSRELTIELANGEVFDTEVTSESFSMEVVNGELIIRIGEQVHTVTLPMGSQADWTQTDPDDPSFIKHKIPIWITQGSADDNMSPIDSVTDGSMRPVTSNAVYDKHYLTSADITNQVTVDNMQSVSSNAVALQVNALNNSISNRAPLTSGVYTLYLTPRQIGTASTFCDLVKSVYDQGYKVIIFSVGWEEYQSFNYPGACGFIIFGHSSARGLGQMWDYGSNKVMYGCYWVDNISLSSYSPWTRI